MQIFDDNPSLKVTATSVTQSYNIIEAAGLDANTVKAALLSYAPITNSPPGAMYAWPRRGITLDEVSASMGVWKATITWASLAYQYAVKIGGHQQQVRQSKSTVHTYGSKVPDTKKAIGWDGRTVHGCSIYVPQRTWTESVEIPMSQYTFDYEDAVDALQQKPVNSGSFRGWDPGEVLFLGMQAQLSTQNPDFVSASFDFSAQWNNSSANGNLLTIGSLTGIEKNGWDYLWVIYTPQTDGTAQVLVPVPKNVFVERVYDYGDFSVLNIGTDLNLPLWQG